MSRVLLAPDKFKGSLTAGQAAEALRRGMLAAAADLDVECLPVADGGDGTVAAAVAAGYDFVPVTATGPTGTPVESGYARHGATAVVELADVSGLARLPGGRLRPLTATSRGTGDLVAAALDVGATRVVLGIGGSACTDGGAGMLQALGARLLDADGQELPSGGAALGRLALVDLGRLHPRLADTEVVVACDVDNPLTGPQGAAAVYGPQKGASPVDITLLDAALGHLASRVAASTGRDLRDEPGAGAAGGVGFAAVAVLGATLRPGIELVLDLLRFRERVRGADLVVVGEGSLDEQTLRGKAPAGVARLARDEGAQVVAVCGRRLLTDDQLRATGIHSAYALTDIEPDPRRCMAQANRLLEQLALRVVHDHLGQPR
jgi:glycerate kinase